MDERPDSVDLTGALRGSRMDIEEWLAGLGLAQYVAAFAAEGIDLSVVATLSDQDLKDLGVSLMGHRRKIMAEAVTSRRGDVHLPPAPGPVRRRRADHGSLRRELFREPVHVVRGEEDEIAVVSEFASRDRVRAAPEVDTDLASDQALAVADLSPLARKAEDVNELGGLRREVVDREHVSVRAKGGSVHDPRLQDGARRSQTRATRCRRLRDYASSTRGTRSRSAGYYAPDKRNVVGVHMGLMTTDFVPAIDREAVLERTRRLKMARSSHRYVRGATEQFYSWLTDRAHVDVPDGPPIWICGDCHLGNLGPLAHAGGSVEIQIRDLDQTVIGNPAHDLLRVSLSLASSSRSSNLRGAMVALMLEAVIDGYGKAFEPEFDVEADLDAPPSILRSLTLAERASWRSLAEDRIDGPTPKIPLGKRFWALTEDERGDIETVCASPEIHALATMLKSRPDNAHVRLIDAAYWVKGCSSLGKVRYAAILAVEGKRKRRYCLMDFKEAGRAVAPSTPGAAMPADPAMRVVAGARALSPHLGGRMAATRVGERSVFVRELLPQDLKLELDLLPAREASDVARYVGAVVGKAHARQMDAATRTGWLRDLKRQSTRVLDAPTWLWTSAVELLAAHERGYLNHCRRHALAEERQAEEA